MKAVRLVVCSAVLMVIPLAAMRAAYWAAHWAAQSVAVRADYSAVEWVVLMAEWTAVSTG